MKQLIILSLIGIALCVGCIGYQIGYQNGVIDGQNQRGGLYALLGGVR